MPGDDLRLGDCLEVMPTLGVVADSVVTDPPYELGFMGREWDRSGVANRPETWAAVRAAMRPGAYLLAFGGTRTSHRMVCAIEDAGFAIRDTLMWIYGQGFPKAKSCLKPGWEPIVLAWNPAKRVPPLNVDGCRIDGVVENRGGWANAGYVRPRTKETFTEGLPISSGLNNNAGRWPANVVLTCCGEDPHLDGCPVAELDRQSGTLSVCGGPKKTHGDGGLYEMGSAGAPGTIYRDHGGASRFFYCSKASRKDRGEGNTHPTVKPTALCQWLTRLVTPPGGTVLDPFMGSGSTGKATVAEGFSFIGIERDPAYHAVASRRLAEARTSMTLLTGVP